MIGFGNLLHTSDFAYFRIHKNQIEWRTDLKFSEMIKNSSSIIPESVTSIYHCREILWLTKFEKLDVWTMHVFPNPVTNFMGIAKYTYIYHTVNNFVVKSVANLPNYKQFTFVYGNNFTSPDITCNNYCYYTAGFFL